MTRKIVFAVVVLVAFLALPAAAQTGPRPFDLQQRSIDGRIDRGDTADVPISAPGTFVVTIHDPRKSPPDRLPLLLTLNSDGCASSTEVPDLIGNAQPGTHTGAHGVWSIVDDFVEVRLLTFTRTSAGRLDLIGRAKIEIAFDPDGEPMSGTVLVEWFHPFQILGPAEPNTNAEPLGGRIRNQISIERITLS